MLDAETKRRIDTARDILVGKVPDPKSQVEQITIALIYKFMDDIDAQSEELGGERSFFAGEFARYGWTALMRSGLGGHEVLSLYAEAITRMPENPGIPPLFRDIFNNAYLPYRDPETLRAFLKVIDEFEYDHSERLGDAFEYLLSVMGSQGDAGQFRTPRHIIDFIVAVIAPRKDETVLDPACGTAGFLISAYKHILAANTDADGQSTLTVDDRGRLASNIVGYDISPDMVRLSLVNMYLHRFAAPRIHEYDTLTSEDRWDEYADVILANPPFMSPKGGIRPHNRFSVTSRRSEVLFVDYMAGHLTPGGRAGIIVPEGVIFQSQKAHTQLRRMLVEDYLVAVVSLPAGVFKPYSGVKASILILDRALARHTDSIAFFKVENDGFDLGDQRRPIDRNDLPKAQAETIEYLRRLRADESLDGFDPTLGLVVKKAKIAEDGDYNLSGERYRENVFQSDQFPLVQVGEIAKELRTGFACGKAKTDVAGVPHIRPMNVSEDGTFTWQGMKNISDEDYRDREDYALDPGDVLFNNTNSVELVGKTCLVTRRIHGGYSNHITRIRVMQDRCDSRYLALVLHSAWRNGVFFARATRWVGQAGINRKSLSAFEIPLPPLDVQRDIVAEIEGYQRVIDGARAVVENYRPHIPIDPEWPVVELRDVIKLSSGQGLTQAQTKDGPFAVYGGNGISSFHSDYFIEDPTIVIGRVGAYCGAVHVTGPKAWVTDNGLYVKSYRSRVNQDFLAQLLTQLDLNRFAKVGGQPSISQGTVYSCEVALPEIHVQRSLVAQLETEQALVDANRELIDRFEQKIHAAIGRVWGEEGDQAPAAEVGTVTEVATASTGTTS